MRHNGRFIGALPVALIATAMINFLAGTTLGMMMALRPAWWHTLGDIHAEINRFGWLTLMIYGMTYAVLAVSAGLRPPHAWVGWLQGLFAEAGALVIVISMLWPRPVLRTLGLWFQALAPTLFLLNILSAVAAGRRARRAGMAPPPVPDRLCYLARSPYWSATDRIGQRGTDLALMFWICAAWAMAVVSLVRPGTDEPSALAMLTDNGWIAGTVLAVAMHLHSRLTGRRVPSFAFLVVQALWLTSVALSVIGRLGPRDGAWLLVAAAGDRVFGAALCVMAATLLITGWAGRRMNAHAVTMRPAGRFGWYVGWLFAAALGVWLMVGGDPLTLAAMHLMFLGWVTSLVYGVAHSVFPDLLESDSPCTACAITQVGCAALGALLMVVGFSAQARGAIAPGWFASGGLLSWLAFLWFAAFWLPRLRGQRADVKHAVL